ncbi:MAG: hypothetical protein HY917_01865 [Candidatus Diapherotrites archaeon]|nr:hypothetical protein [Candidatus Diapherotrites archaeon]
MKNEKDLLKEEIETYYTEKRRLVEQNNGKFVLIKKKSIVGTYDAQTDAIRDGITKFGNTPFLVKKIEEIETPQNFTSNLIRLNELCLQ